jgi:hypothetical protein
MGTVQQHRIPLKGYEDSIDEFTKVLRDLKLSSGHSSAEVIMRSIKLWEEEGFSTFTPDNLKSKRTMLNLDSVSRPFHLQLLTCNETLVLINAGKYIRFVEAKSLPGPRLT